MTHNTQSTNSRDFTTTTTTDTGNRTKGTERRAAHKKRGTTLAVEGDDKTKQEHRNRKKAGTTVAVGDADNKTTWSKRVLTMSCKGLSEEFAKKIKKFVDPKCPTMTGPKCEEKNRYADVLCLEDTRVRLRNRRPDDDYIHANWVRNPDGSKAICTQGPLAETIEDFWWMVVKERAHLILMLCQFLEGAEETEKCARYFPTSVDEHLTFGPFTVKNLDVDTRADIEGCTITKLEIKFAGKSYRVQHALMASWPDQCAPLTSTAVLALHKWSKKHSHGKDTPVVIHCSAGVGRTATFAAIDLAVHCIAKNPDVSMMEVVKKMRSQRYQAVQSVVQYLFLHLLMLDLFVMDGIAQPYKEDCIFIKEYKRYATKKMVKTVRKQQSEKMKRTPLKQQNSTGRAAAKAISNVEDD